MSIVPLFLAHGMGTDLEEPTWPGIEAAELEPVLRHFRQAGALREIFWRSPRPFSAAAGILTDRSRFFVKRHHHTIRTPEDVREEHNLIRYLHRQGQPVVTLLTTEAQDTVYSDGVFVWEVHESAPGEDLYRDRTSWTPYISEAQAHAAGQSLARLHHALRDYDAPARRTRVLIANDRLFRKPDPIAALKLEMPERKALHGFLKNREWKKELREHLTDPWHPRAQPVLCQQPHRWAHGDWHGSNLLWSAENTVRTVLDFGLSDRSSFLFDVATALERSFVSWLDMEARKTPVCHADQMAMFLRGYAGTGPEYAEILRGLSAVLPVIHADFAISETEYFAGIPGNEGNLLLAWEGYLLGHADWFHTVEGKRMLRLADRLAAELY